MAVDEKRGIAVRISPPIIDQKLLLAPRRLTTLRG